MPLELKQVHNKEDFVPLVAIEFEVYSNPSNGFWEMIKGPSIHECCNRQWSWHTHDPNSTWLSVYDTNIDQAIGATQWILHETSPYMKPDPPAQATWWEEGDLKVMTERVLDQFSSHRPKRMSRPHLLLNYCFVSKKHQRRGAGRALTEWGCKLADEKGLECFVESTDEGVPLYTSMGFVVVDHYDFDPDTKNTSNSYKELKGKLWPQPMRCWIMWRPKGGKFVEGQTKYSWEEV